MESEAIMKSVCAFLKNIGTYTIQVIAYDHVAWYTHSRFVRTARNAISSDE